LDGGARDDDAQAGGVGEEGFGGLGVISAELTSAGVLGNA
jgi:hypothetical protein